MFNRFSYKDMIPPEGTMAPPRPLTKRERKLQGRNNYAKYVSCILDDAYNYLGIDSLIVRENQYTVSIKLSKDKLSVKCSPVFEHWNTENVYPFNAMHEGQSTVKDWLVNQNPCFAARILKALDKILRDRKSLAGMKEKKSTLEFK
jgi:hypothetical protein